jgi:hypothetical protein
MITSDETRFRLYDYRDRRGRNDIADWMRKQEKRQRGQVNLKLDMLQKYGDDVGSNVLLRMSATIFKLKGKTKGVQLRPMLCKGPVHDQKEFTILIGAVEVDWELRPADIVERAEERREEVIANESERRVVHERVD